jgi:hypothetical protein
MLVRLLYASRSVKPIDGAMLERILEQSRRNNRETGVTGVLCVCEGDVFLQALEGSREAVNRLYATVLRDDRHVDVTLLDYEEILARRFAGWRMGRVDLGRVNAAVVLKYSATSKLDPYTISGRTALVLLEELLDSASIVGGS